MRLASASSSSCSPSRNHATGSDVQQPAHLSQKQTATQCTLQQNSGKATTQPDTSDIDIDDIDNDITVANDDNAPEIAS